MLREDSSHDGIELNSSSRNFVHASDANSPTISIVNRNESDPERQDIQCDCCGNVNNRNAIRSAIGGLLLHLVFGNLYTWGIITTAVTAYLRSYNPSLTYSDTLAVYVTQLAFVGIFMGVGGYLQVRIGARYTCFLAGLLIVIGAFLSAFMKTLVGLCITAGAMFGMGAGMGYSAPIVCTTKWRSDKKGFISGFILSGFGGGSCCFGFIDTAILHHGATIQDSTFIDGYFSPNSSIPNMVPTMYMTLGFIYLVFVVVGCLLLVEKNDCENEVTDDTIQFSPIANSEEMVRSEHKDDTFGNDSNRNFSLNTSNKVHYNLISEVEKRDTTRERIFPNEFRDTLSVVIPDSSSPSEAFIDYMGPKELICDPLGWHITMCYSLTAVAGIFVTGTYKIFGLTQFHDDLYLSYLGSSAALFNVLGRLTWGAIADAVGPTTMLCILSFFFTIALFTYSQSPAIGGKFAFSVWTYIIFALEGGIFSLYLPQCILLFGPKNAGKNYGLVFGGFSVVNVIVVVLLSKLHVQFASVSIILGSIVLVGLISLILLRIHIFKRFRIRT